MACEVVESRMVALEVPGRYLGRHPLCLAES